VETIPKSEGIPEPVDPIIAGTALEPTEPVAERFRVGRITDLRLASPTEFGMTNDESPAAIYEVSVEDPYVEAYSPEEQRYVTETERAINDFAHQRRVEGKWDRQPGRAYIDGDNTQQKKNGRTWGDPVSTDIHFNQTLQSQAVRIWRKEIVPSALALAYLTDPQSALTVTSPKTGEIAEVDDEARLWWSLCTDARAIRSRGTVMAEIVKEFAQDQMAERGENSGDFRWLSIACGTALPSMQGAVHAGIRPTLTLVDFDPKAMDTAVELGAEVGFEGEIEKLPPVNIFDNGNMAELKDELEAKGELPQMVDMMGIFEYTGNNLGVDPVKFLKSGYDFVAPGGRLVFGQMRDDRPVGDFTMGVVGWPYVEQRSPSEVMKMITEAGIDPKLVRMFMPTDGVYTVVTIDKPDKPVQPVIPAPR
jgi:SAM-dependent methyltransferase